MKFLKEFLQESAVKNFFAIVFLVVLLFSVRSMFNLLLLTFIFTFLFSSIINLIYVKVGRLIPLKRGLVAVVVYLSAIVGLIIAGVKYIPQLGKQLMNIGTQISTFNLENYVDNIDPRIFNLIDGIKIDQYVAKATKAIMEYVPHVGEFSLNLFIALLLSFFIIMEKEEISKFGKKMEKSKVAGLYLYYKIFGQKFLNSFGKVLQVQILISFINSVLSVIMLAFLGFNQVIGLGFMIFVFGLIPVAGVVASFIPLSIIGFTMGGISQVAMVVAMILILHALESYILNPKLMSVKTKLPVFFTFVILIFGEHFIGMWGLLVGLPLFIFFLDLAGVNTTEKKKEAIEETKQEKATPQ